MQGSIVHEVLAAWWAQPGDVAPLFEDVFERYVEDERIPSGYHTERLRNAMLDDLRAFAADGQWPRGDFQSRMEEKFVFRLDESLEISGKIDRLDTAPDGRAYVIDYKYSNAQNTKDKLKDENLLQAPLYLMAAEEFFGVKPAGMFYVGLKGGVVYAGWNEIPEGWLERKKEQTLQVVAEIRAGRVEAAPANPDKCRYCEFRDVCRVEVGEARSAGGGRMKRFTPDQLDAVDVARRHLDACVVAGPGSGKTTVLVEYFRRLVAAGVDPLRILAITFTEKAAGNMRKKLAQEFQDAPKSAAGWSAPGSPRSTASARACCGKTPSSRESTRSSASWRGTKRGACSRNPSPRPSMRCFEEHPAPLRALIRGLSSSEFEEAVLSAYDTMRGAGVRVEDLAGFASPARRHDRPDRRHDERASQRAADGLERPAAPAPGLDPGRRGAHCDGDGAARSAARDRRLFRQL